MNIKIKTLSLAVISVILVGLGIQGCSVTSKSKTDSAPQAVSPVKEQVEATAKSQPWTPPKPDTTRTIAPYFVRATTNTMTPDNDGFIRRWLLLEPIVKPNRSNTVFTDSYIRTAFTTEYFPNQFTVLPKDGDKVTVTVPKSQPAANYRAPQAQTAPAAPEMVTVELKWHALESTNYNVKLFRFAYGLRKDIYGVLFWAVTVVNSPVEIKNVRMAVGSNSASMWWLNGKEAVVLSGDRRMVMDDATSTRLTLNPGKNIIRGAVINGPGMSDFCVRFLDEKGQPVKNITISCE